MKQMMGEDATEDIKKEDISSPGGIVVETLLNMGTVSALTLEDERFNLFQEAMVDNQENYVKEGVHQGVLSGLSIGLQEWVMALEFWFGGWLLTKFPENYTFYDFMVAMFALLFGIFSLGIAFQDMADRKETEASANRIFYLIDRESSIDPLSEEGKTVDYNSLPKPKPKKKKSLVKKKSIKKEEKKKKKPSSKKNVAEEQSDSQDADDAPVVEKKKPKSKKSSKKLLNESDHPEEDNADVEEKKSKKEKSKKSSKKLLDADKKPKSSKKKKSKKDKKPSSDKEIAPEEEDEFINSIDNVVQHTSEEIVFTPDEDTTEEGEDVTSPQKDFKSLRAALEEKSADIPPPKPEDVDDLFVKNVEKE